MIKKILEIIISKIPVSHKILAFNSYPDFTDNAYAMYSFLYHQYGDKYHYVWLINEGKNIEAIKENIGKEACVTVVKKKSMKGLWLFLRARHVFYTHGIFESILVRQTGDKMINLWHGMPLKRIGLMDNKSIGYMHNLQYTIATSPLFQKLMAESFGVNAKQVLVVGQPRCDMLNESTDFFDGMDIDVGKFKSIGIWMPTYRKSIVATEMREDGNYEDGKIGFLHATELGELNNELRKTGNLLIIKLHPMDALQKYKFEDYSNILILKLENFHYQLYPLLGKCDFLITDFSSVWVDYELCNKPMAFVVDDFENYKSNRGFTLDNLLDVLPGTLLKSKEELLNFIIKPKCINKGVEFNTFKDNLAAKRIADYLNL